MYGIVVSVCLEDGGILLCINAIVTWFNIIDSSSLDNSSGGLDMILNSGCIFALLWLAVELIIEDSSIEPVSIVDLYNTWVSIFICWRFEVSQIGNLCLVEILGRFDLCLIGV